MSARDAELEALWRPDPDFIGPVAPPMILWLWSGSPPDAWQIAAERRHACREAFGQAFDLPLFSGLPQ